QCPWSPRRVVRQKEGHDKDFARRLNQILPLSMGKGRGEGKGNVANDRRLTSAWKPGTLSPWFQVVTAVIVLVCALGKAAAETVQLHPVADTTLIEVAPDS